MLGVGGSELAGRRRKARVRGLARKAQQELAGQDFATLTLEDLARSLLAFTATGESPAAGDHREVLVLALRELRSRWDSEQRTWTSADRSPDLEARALATVAAVECWELTRSPLLRPMAQGSLQSLAGDLSARVTAAGEGTPLATEAVFALAWSVDVSVLADSGSLSVDEWEARLLRVNELGVPPEARLAQASANLRARAAAPHPDAWQALQPAADRRLVEAALAEPGNLSPRELFFAASALAATSPAGEKSVAKLALPAIDDVPLRTLCLTAATRAGSYRDYASAGR